MSILNLTTIKNKLIAITMISCMTSLVVAGSVMILYSWDSHKESMVNRLHVLATVLGDRSHAALAFNDTRIVQENLHALEFEPSVLLACIYSTNTMFYGNNDEGGHLVAQHLQKTKQKETCPIRHNVSYPDAESVEYDDHGNLHIHHDIVLDREKIGEIIMYSDNDMMTRKVLVDSIIIVLIMILGISVAYLLILKLQRYISRPIQMLSETATQISDHHDASLRAVKHSNDETGILVGTFNNMLDTIEEQNRTLTNVKNNYLALYDKNPMMLFTLDIEGRVISVNEYGATHIGRPVNEIINTKFCDLLHRDDIDITNHFLHSCITSSEQVQRKDIRIVDSSGKTIWTRSTARSIINENDEHDILFVCEDITEQKKLSEKLSFQASHDALTGLVNRREFEYRIDDTINKSQENKLEHALFFLDLDQFKIINDTCGHLAGDHLLRELVSIINPLIRRGDTLARIGGDEFGVLLENCSLNQASNVAEQIRKAIYEYRFTWEQKELGIGVSIGVVPINQYTANITIAMSDADAACYIAKESGRNKIHIYQQGDEEIATRHGEMTWVNRIQKALNNDQFLLVAQTITGIKESNSDSRHIEILIRMLDEDENIIAPDQFLPAAERYNLSPKIDRWVVTNTFEWLSSNIQQLDLLDLCSINISGNTLGDDGFSDFLLQQFLKYDIPSEKICFEITETSAISNLDVAKNFFHSFSNELRCKFSLDDFGTGLSSFAYLQTMPVDFIKIDGQFVRDITSNPIDMAMVRSINEIGQIMGKQTIAEFVENEQTLNQLKLIGIDFAQGYHISKPVPLDELCKLKQNHNKEA